MSKKPSAVVLYTVSGGGGGGGFVLFELALSLVSYRTATPC